MEPPRILRESKKEEVEEVERVESKRRSRRVGDDYLITTFSSITSNYFGVQCNFSLFYVQLRNPQLSPP